MAKSSLLLGHTLMCMVHFVPYYNKNKNMIYILRDSLRGAYFIKRSRVPFHQYQILLF